MLILKTRKKERREMKNEFPNVPAVLPSKCQIPKGYRLMVHKWSYPENRIGEMVNVNGRQIKKMLTLDINIPRADFAAIVNAGSTAEEVKGLFSKNYPCPHRCPGCFNNAELHNPIMRFDEVINVIDQAKELGLESVKFLGPGELLANPELFSILDAFVKRDIVIGIFTKGAIMGNDSLSKHYHSLDSEELTRRLVAYPNVTFLVGGRSFDPSFENKFIPQNKKEFAGEFDYHKARNNTIEQLCRAGMNADLTRQRMAIACSPITAQNISGAFEIYRWGVERNIPVYIPPTMVSGKGHNLVKSAHDAKFENDYIDMAVEVYLWTIERGVMSFEQLLHEGVHPYIGVTPCNQLTHGLYIHYDGAVWRCPGNDTPNFIVHPNVRDKSLLDIWVNSVNYPINLFNNRCVKDGVSLPHRFYTEVLERVRGHLMAK
ncbi:MAG: SPASM domain-containing protein [Patescibacteria group bacterium]